MFRNGKLQYKFHVEANVYNPNLLELFGTIIPHTSNKINMQT